MMRFLHLLFTTLVVWPFVGFGLSLLIPDRFETLLRRISFGTVLVHMGLILIFAQVWIQSGAVMVNLPELVLYRHADYVFLIDLFFDHITLVYLSGVRSSPRW